MSDEELIDGIYKLVMCIATGGSSQVWEVIEQASGRHLAMKLLKMDHPDYVQHKADLKHESAVLKSLEHPMIIKFEKYSTSRDNTYMTMEHFRAPNVKLQLKADMSSVHIRARRLFEGVCQALSHVHSKGWIHRDIKPDNVLMNKVGEIRLVDFSLSSKEVTGFAKMMGGGKLKTIQGTRTYIAPETINKLSPTFQTDIYSLGIMFFEVLTGKTPFAAATPEELLRKHLRVEPPNASEFNTNVTPEMDRLIAKMLKKKPAERHATVDDVLGELRRIKIFKEDITEESIAKKADEGKDTMSELTDIRLDSRADARLRETLAASPELARQFQEVKREQAAKKLAADERRKQAIIKGSTPAKTAAPVAAAPVPMQMPPGYFPPGYAPFPQMPMAVPPGAMPGYPNMPMNPGMPFPPQGQFNPQVMPQMPAPQMPMPQTQMPMPQTGLPTPVPTPAMAPVNVPAVMMPQTPLAAPAPMPVVSNVPAPVAPRPATPVVAAAPQQQVVPSVKQVVPQQPVPSPNKPAAAPSSPASPPPDELEFMTELPDVI